MGLEAKRIKRKLNRLLGQSQNDLKLEGEYPHHTLHEAQRISSYYGGRIDALKELIAYVDNDLVA